MSVIYVNKKGELEDISHCFNDLEQHNKKSHINSLLSNPINCNQILEKFQIKKELNKIRPTVVDKSPFFASP